MNKSKILLFSKDEQKKIFFIIAPDRAGSSKFQEIMNTFPGFCNLKESRVYDSDNSPSCWDNVIRYRNYNNIENFIKKNWTKEYFVEKSNPSINCIPEIYDRFPDANFIFLERNPIKIILSQINLFHGMSQIGNRENDLFRITKKGKYLIRERFLAKRLLKMVHSQVTYKSKFREKLTIKFEDYVKSLESQLKKIEYTFGVKPNYKEATNCLEKPSYSTTYRYGIKELQDKEAIDMVRIACNLWDYDYDDTINKNKNLVMMIKK